MTGIDVPKLRPWTLLYMDLADLDDLLSSKSIPIYTQGI